MRPSLILNYLKYLDCIESCPRLLGVQDFGLLRPGFSLFCQKHGRYSSETLICEAPLDREKTSVFRPRRHGLQTLRVRRSRFPGGPFPPATFSSRPQLQGAFALPRSVAHPFRGEALSLSLALANGPLHNLSFAFLTYNFCFSSPQQFLNPAFFFFANFPWQGHNVRGVPKEP
jgi:hypothetical protein